MAFTGRTEDGRAVSYTDRKRHLYFFSLFLPMVPTLSVIGFLLTGNVLMTLVPEGEALVAALSPGTYNSATRMVVMKQIYFTAWQILPGYGLFAGRGVTWATLRFSPRLARFSNVTCNEL